ncbi:MAG: hypothetical protein ACLPHP_22040 [Candidatus Sulfotelmatobacter sp.]
MYSYENSSDATRALNEFHTPFRKKISPAAQNPPETLRPPAAEQTARAIQYVSTYLRQHREHYFAIARPLSHQQKVSMGSCFPPALLDQVRIVQLEGQRIPTPPFYAEARALGFDNLPEITHMDSVTFLDVVVFNEALTPRSLFHALVHVVQFHILGVERYTELFVGQFMRTRTHFTVPLEAQAFSLTSKFMRPCEERFSVSVEDEVRNWATGGRY